MHFLFSFGLHLGIAHFNHNQLKTEMGGVECNTGYVEVFKNKILSMTNRKMVASGPVVTPTIPGFLTDLTEASLAPLPSPIEARAGSRVNTTSPALTLPALGDSGTPLPFPLSTTSHLLCIGLWFAIGVGELSDHMALWVGISLCLPLAVGVGTGSWELLL